MACNTQTAGSNSANNRFRVYKNTTIAGNPKTYPCDFTLYKLDEEPEEPIPTPTPEPDPGPVESEGPIADGDRVVIWNPANGKALSSTYSGFYNNGVDVTEDGGTLSGFTAAEVWTVGVNEDGTYTFSTAGGKKLAMGAEFASMPLDEVNQS